MVHMPSITERLGILETDVENHKTQCVVDKINNKDRFDSIDAKLWAIMGAVVVQLIIVVGYLMTNGTPWISSAVASVSP